MTHDKGKGQTKERLAQAIHALGLFDLEKRARAAEFSDFEGPHALPKYVLVKELTLKANDEHDLVKAQMIRQMAARIVAGEFDDSEEEAQAWANKSLGRLLG